MIKRLVALLLVLLLSIESFAAVVSDNDGSAFITKAEFDSLKNNFQSQIDQYNTSMDSKIDGAIASYLAGLKTTKYIEYSNLVSNYQEMLWKRAFDVYGSYKKFTSKNNKEVQQDNVWYLPHIQDFFSLRRSYYQISMPKIRDDGGSVTNIRGDWDLNYGRFVIVDDGYYFPRFAISCDCDRDDEIILKDFTGWQKGYFPEGYFPRQRIFINKSNTVGRSYAQQSLEDYLMIWNGSSWVQDSSTSTHTKASAPLLDSVTTVPWIEDLGADGDEILDWRIAINYNNNRDNIASNRFTLTPREVSPLQYWMSCAMDYLKLSQLEDSKVSSSTFSNNFWNSPLWVEVLDQSTARQQCNHFKHLMLGKDFNWETAIERISDKYATMAFYDISSKYSTYEDLFINVNTVSIGATNPWTKDTNTKVTHSTPVHMKWRVPYQEKYDFKKITSGKFKLNGVNLKFGQGLPIVQSLQDIGDLILEFDYNIGRTAGECPSSATGIEIDLKNNDYLNSTGDYYVGYLNDNTNSSTIHNLEVDNTAKHVKLVININVAKLNQSMWLRVAPKSTDGGLYAKILNLKVKLEN